MKILLAAAEIAELAPVGGVAEYVLGLAAALLRKGHEVRAVVPAYGYLFSEPHVQPREVVRRLPVALGVGASGVTAVHEVRLRCPGDDSMELPVLLMGSHPHIESVGAPRDVYDWPNPEPWIAFSRAVFEYVHREHWVPDVIHCQDAHAALVPVYVANLRAATRVDRVLPPATTVRTVLTIHNLLYQGEGSAALVSYAGLPAGWMNWNGFEYYAHANCLKAALYAADRITTVSRTYATEIAGSDLGFGLQGVLATRTAAGIVSGILNGIDEARWRMEGLGYDGRDDVGDVLKRKRARRATICERWGWRDATRPIAAFRGRWDTQKGVLELAAAAERIAQQANLLVVTWGYPGATPELRSAWQALGDLAEQRPEQVRVNPEAVNQIEQTALHYEVADLFLMPSRYEPCGLAQMECQRFGTIPVVRRTGGLADTVFEEAEPGIPSPNGFVFEESSPEALLDAVTRAVRACGRPAAREGLVANALLQRNGWDTRVAAYEGVYR